MRALDTRLALLIASLSGLGACGHQRVQLYEGAPLPVDRATVLWSNPHLDLTVDRQYTVPAEERSKLHRLELPAGHHTVEVRCLYQNEKYTMSPVIPLVIDGEATHLYKPRVRFERTAEGVPGCRVKIFDVTSQSGGQKIDSY